MGKRSNSLFLPYNENSSQPSKPSSTSDNSHTTNKSKNKLSLTKKLKLKHSNDKQQSTHDDQTTKSNDNNLHKHQSSMPSEPAKKRVRSNQERPAELSSAKPVSQLVALNNTLARQHITTYKPADPRYELDSTFSDTMYSRAYKFIDELKNNEINQLKSQLQSKSLNQQQRADIQQQLKQHVQLHKSQQQRQHQRSVIQQWKKSERQLQSSGKTPYYMKSSEQKKLLLAQKYIDLKQNGHSAINKYIEKKQKQSTQSARKFIPNK